GLEERHDQRERDARAVGTDVGERAPGDVRVVDGAVDVRDVGEHVGSGAAASIEAAHHAAATAHHETSSFSDSSSSASSISSSSTWAWLRLETSLGSASWLA